VKNTYTLISPRSNDSVHVDENVDMIKAKKTKDDIGFVTPKAKNFNFPDKYSEYDEINDCIISKLNTRTNLPHEGNAIKYPGKFSGVESMNKLQIKQKVDKLKNNI